MNLGPRGIYLIKRFETLRLEAYKPTPDDVPTIGWGHTRGVKLGDTCTPEQAEVWLREDLRAAVDAVNRRGFRLTQSMFDALVSLVFNAGPRPLWNSSAIGRGLRDGRYFDAWAVFAGWRKQKGKDMLGLARRRAEEMDLYLEDGLP